jgi:hypothetical protein
VQRYIEITEENLLNLHDSLELLEMLDRDKMMELDLHVYGITQEPSLIDAAKEAIADGAENEISEQDVQLTEIAVAIPVSADFLYVLGGSGLKLKREEFAYLGQGGEGIRTLSFAFASFKPTAALSSMSQLALASSDSWLDDYLQQFGNKQPAKIENKVRRTEEATQPNVPATAELPPQPAQQPLPKQTSLIGGLKLAELLDEFLS